MSSLTTLEKYLNYAFTDKRNASVLIEYDPRKCDKSYGTFQSLEHLGDSVLGHIVSLWSFKNLQDRSPESITQLKSFVVSNSNLADVVKSSPLIEINTFISHAQQDLNKFLADMFEALVAIIYIDTDYDFNLTYPIIVKLLSESLSVKPDLNSKSKLNILTRQLNLSSPIYHSELTNSGYISACKVSCYTEKANAPTQKQAELLAAKKILTIFDT